MFLTTTTKQLLLLCFCCAGFTAAAQPGINSLYSAYGFGLMDLRDNNAYTSMSGAGIALRGSHTINTLNPASYSAINAHRLLFEMSVQGSSQQYVTSTQNLSGGDINFKRAAIAANLFKNWTSVISMQRLSQVDYKSVSVRNVGGSVSKITDYITGSGGLNQAFLGNAWQVGKHFSIGLNTGMIFGSVNKKNQVLAGEQYNLTVEQNDFYSQFFWKAGLQWTSRIGKTQWTVGGTFQPALQLDRISDYYIKDANETVLVEEKGGTQSFQYPMQYAAGISMQKGGSTFSLDAIRQPWSSVNYRGTNFKTKDASNFALGYRFTKMVNSYYGKIEKYSLSAGLQFDDGYLEIYKVPIRTYSATVGMGFPSRNGTGYYNFSVRTGQRGQVGTTLVKEKFVDVHVNISLATLLFVKGRQYD